MVSAAYKIDVMTEKEVQLAVDWAAAEGWNPGLNDAAVFYGADPRGFLAGFLDGHPIASISAIRYGEDFGFIGFYIVKPEFRGKGFGLRLWQAAMAQLTGRNIGLDGVVAQQDNYQKSGFNLAYRNIRYQAQLPDLPVEKNPNIVALTTVPFDTLTTYDSTCFFAPRPVFLARWIDQSESRALGYISNGQLQGYGVIRQCRAGYKIGPLFADDPRIAAQLFAELAPFATGQALFLDVPEPNSAAVSLATRYHMSPVFYTARMYTGNMPSMNLNQVFGVTSFELG
jgi:ribosomal protein S18 acetylase RimI-like enzyme